MTPDPEITMDPGPATEPAPPPDPRAELMALQAELAAQDAAALEAAAARRDGLAVANARALLAARKKVGDPSRLAVVEVDPDHPIVILSRAHQAIYQRFQDEGSLKSDALLKLVQGSVEYPDKAAFSALLDELPAVLVRCADAIAVLAGAGATIQAKK